MSTAFNSLRLFMVAALAPALLVACGPDTPSATVPVSTEAAIASLRAQLRANPSDATLRVRIARLYIVEGDGAAAEAYLRRALDDGSSDPRARTDLVRSLLMQDEHFEALEMVEALEARALAPPALLAMLRGEAQMGSANFDAVAVRDSFIEAFKWLPAAEDRETAQRLMTLAGEETIVEAARSHVECRTGAVTLIEPPTPPAGRRLLQVGPTRQLKTPSAAAQVAHNGDRIEIDAGVYRGDVAIWEQDDLILIGVGGMAQLDAAGRSADEKAIWVFEGDRITAQNIAFSGAKVPNRNGAGIRLHGSNATIRNCHFHDNENGILGSNRPDNDVLVEFSTFERNGYGDGQSHNIYIGRANSFVMRYSLSRASHVGHLVKSRARENAILFNRLVDDEGDGSYVINLPEGGRAWIVGNELQKGSNAKNPHVISFGEENAERADQALFVVNNTVYNRELDATFVRNSTEFDAVIANNLIAGAPALLVLGQGVEMANLRRPGAWFQDAPAHDYRLTRTAPAIDAGFDPALITGLRYLPESEYRHPARGQSRRPVAAVDIGAREFCGY